LRAWDEKNLSRAKYDWIWEGHFNDEVEDSIIKPEWYDAAIDAHKIDHLKKVFRPLGARIASHDPSDTGADAKALACRHGSIITHVKEKLEGDISDGCDWATDEAVRLDADWFVWDGDGMGTGLKKQISIAFDGKHTKYHMFRGSLSGKGQDRAEKIYLPSDGDEDTKPKKYKETFKNNRAQYYIGELARRLENTYKCVVKGEYIDPEDMLSFDSEGIDNPVQLRSEICRVPRKHNGNGLEQVMDKKEMARQGIKSPNMSDAVMMCLFTPKAKKKPANVSIPNSFNHF